VTPFFNLVCRPILMYSVTTTRDIAQMEFMLPRIRDLASYVTFPIELVYIALTFYTWTGKVLFRMTVRIQDILSFQRFSNYEQGNDGKYFNLTTKG
jgi:hypothetical protein